MSIKQLNISISNINMYLHVWCRQKCPGSSGKMSFPNFKGGDGKIETLPQRKKRKKEKEKNESRPIKLGIW
jgi:hypothetical protein